MAYSRKVHLENEHNTRDLIRYISKNYKINSAEQVFGLINFTWGGEKPKIDGYNLIFDKDSSSIDEISNSIKDKKLKSLFDKETGFVNFYKAYRNSAFKWAVKNKNTILDIFNKCREIKTEKDIIQISKILEELPLIPKPNHSNQKMECTSLITPFLACFDPTGKFPVVNKREATIELYRTLGIVNLSLSEKVIELLNVIYIRIIFGY